MVIPSEGKNKLSWPIVSDKIKPWKDKLKNNEEEFSKTS